MAVDFTDGSSAADRYIARGPEATLLLFVGDEYVSFVRDSQESELELGDPCVATSHHLNACNTTFPVTCLLFEDAMDGTIYACNGNVTGRVFLEFDKDLVPPRDVPYGSTNPTVSDGGLPDGINPNVTVPDGGLPDGLNLDMGI